MRQEETRDGARWEDDLKASWVSFFEATTVFHIIGAWPWQELLGE